MTTTPVKSNFYADFNALSSIKADAKVDQNQALRKAAQEFESLFTNMLLKSMREATSSIESSEHSNEMDLYQGMYDQQIATQLSKGKGLGLADLLVRQLATQQPAATPAVIDQTAALSTRSGQTASTTSVTSSPVPNSPSQFIEQVLPQAKQAADTLGVDPLLLVAHAALETGWGRHVPTQADGDSSFNLFGIKAGASWKGDSVQQSTGEFIDGKATSVKAAFRSYGSLGNAFADYQNVLSLPRYAALRDAGSDAGRFADTLQSAGYATDPHYADKLKSVVEQVRRLTGISGTPVADAAATNTLSG